MIMSESRVIALWKEGCSVKRIADWGENADNPKACKKLGNLKKDLPVVEQIIWDYQMREKMIFRRK